jgi:hypothetical protein
MSITNHQETLCANLLDLLNRVDSSPIILKQNIQLYIYRYMVFALVKHGVSESWNSIPISSVKCVLESKDTLFLNK